jgi:O-antigen ligase
MIRVVYMVCVGCAAAAWLHLFARRVRTGLVVLVAVVSVVPEAFPWHLIPINGVSVGVQLASFGLAGAYFLTRRDMDRALRPLANPYTLLIVSFSVVLVGYLWISSNAAYGDSKTFLFVYRGVLPYLALGALGPLLAEERRALFVSLIVGSVLAAGSLLAYGDIYLQRVSFTDTSPITLGRAIGIGAALLGTCLLASRKLSRRTWIMGLLLVPALGGVAALTGSRGPLAAAAAATLTMGLFWPSGLRSKTRATARVAVLACAAVGLLFLLPLAPSGFASVARLDLYFQTVGTNSSDSIRVDDFDAAWHAILTSGGAGVGTGDFATLIGTTGRAYPHNLFLEVGAEQGVLGLAILLLILLATIMQLWRWARSASSDGVSAALASLFVYALTNALVSGDISANYQLWIFTGLVWLMTRATSAEESRLVNDQGQLATTRGA